jgi:hypothetical protein
MLYRRPSLRGASRLRETWWASLRSVCAGYIYTQAVLELRRGGDSPYTDADAVLAGHHRYASRVRDSEGEG